jgi:hypothetical protein
MSDAARDEEFERSGAARKANPALANKGWFSLDANN